MMVVSGAIGIAGMKGMGSKHGQGRRGVHLKVTVCASASISTA